MVQEGNSHSGNYEVGISSILKTGSAEYHGVCCTVPHELIEAKPVMCASRIAQHFMLIFTPRMALGSANVLARSAFAAQLFEMNLNKTDERK